MDDPKSREEELNKLAEAWKQYGETYNLFVPDEQPSPKGDGSDSPIPELSERGVADPQFMTHWRFFGATRTFLKQRYEGHGILQSPPSERSAAAEVTIRLLR
jgi:hypothetical protein